ncbi:MAG: molybdopterin-dependent oxidoreductase [Firmicutes bacterium]|nr:molybdopterin-dependent oxidoreductase [Bacillota bacterium]
MSCVNFCRKKEPMATFLLLLFLCISGYGCTASEEVAAGTIVIEGEAVENRVFITLEDLKSMGEGLVEADYFFLNSYGTKGYSHFKGIWVWYLLKEKVSLKENASRVSFIAEDGYTAEFTMEDVKREDYIDEQDPETKYKMILAWEEDGREFDAQKGNPFQLVVGQREPGDVNKPCWVRHIKTIRID